MVKPNQGSDDFNHIKSFLIGDDEYPPCNTTVPFELEELKDVPYYKKPLVQLLVVFGTGISVIYLIILAFKTESPSIAQATPVQQDQEKANLLLALQQEQEKTRQLELQNALLSQQELDVTMANKAKPKPKPQPTPVAKTTPTPPPQTVSAPKKPQPTYKPNPPRRPASISRPTVKPQPVVETPPPPDPMTQWLAIANQGHYTTSYTTEKPATSLVSNETSLTRQPLSNNNYPLLKDSQLNNALQNSSLLSDDELVARINGKVKTRSRVVAQTSNRPLAKASGKIIDIGSSGKATLESAVVWTSNRSQQSGKKYLLLLKDDFKNFDGEVILPKQTRLIAQVREYSSSGLLTMEIAEILYLGKKIKIPSGSLMVEGKKGSPLKADLKQKGDSDFLADVGSILAPGVERALDSANDTLIVQNGSVFQTNNRRDPLTSGVSGVASGISNNINRRISRNQRESILSYFQLDSGKTVYLKAYEDITF